MVAVRRDGSFPASSTNIFGTGKVHRGSGLLGIDLTLRVIRIPLLRAARTITLRAGSGNISGTYTPERSCGMYFTNRAVRWAVPQAIGDDGILCRRNSNIEGNSASQRMRHDRPRWSPYTKTAKANRSLCRIPCCTKVVIAIGVGVAGNRSGLSPRD